MKKTNEQVRIQDDLFQSVNGEWIKKAVIPNDLPTTGSFVCLDQDVEKTLTADLDAFADGTKKIEMPVLENAVRLYKKALDEDAREKDGVAPALPLLEKIKNIKSIDELNARSTELVLDGITLPFTLEITEDVRDTSRRALSLLDPDIILPDKALYDNKVAKLMMMKIYKKMVASLLKLTPLSKKEQKQYLCDAIAFDDILRKKVKSPTEMADYVKLFNPTTLDDAAKSMKPFDLAALIGGIYGDKTPDMINLGNPAFIKEFGEILNDDTFVLFVHWSYVNTLLSCAPALSKKISDLSKEYMRKLTGIKEAAPIKKDSYRLVSSVYSEPIGVYYGRTYFGEEAKRDVTEMTQKIIDTYKLRVEKNGFLEAATKERAIKKLSAIKIKMGYPDKYDEFYDTLAVEEGDCFFEAMMKIKKAKIRHELEKLCEPTDFTKWAMPGHMVNASYDPFKNDITFPAAILQKPFYDLSQSKEENLGGIGAVIGQEISHAFDNNGSHFDEKGNMNDWWNEEDFKKFEELTEKMVRQYDGIDFHGGKVNGRLVVSENIADNGGMAVTIEIMHTLENPDFKKYFINWAKIWCRKAQEGYIKLLLRMDVHSPAELRANITPRNFGEWYEAFDVKSGDGMYIEESERISIW
ncbi:MAG: M13 family metallopeptidase [Clostridia bacterium]|nr:M13 family metallopeptidase [Clostridia bacterium]